MSIKIPDKKEGRERAYSHRNIVIKCPDCGVLLNFTDDNKCICEKCEKSFTDDEVRARCGL